MDRRVSELKPTDLNWQHLKKPSVTSKKKMEINPKEKDPENQFS
jgi:hypothetical protein